MVHKQAVTKWLKNNTELSWSRTGGDLPPKNVDKNYINRSEGYEIRDLIVASFDDCDFEYSDDNFNIAYKIIMGYKKGHKVKRVDLLNHLSGNVH